jgi:hypothetical protein
VAAIAADARYLREVDESQGMEDFEAFAREQRAVAEVGRRRVALQSKVLGVVLGAAFAPGLLGVMLVRGWMRSAGMAAPRHGGGIGFLILMIVAVLIGRVVARRMVRSRAETWLHEAAILNDVPVERLRAALPADDGVI